MKTIPLNFLKWICMVLSMPIFVVVMLLHCVKVVTTKRFYKEELNWPFEAIVDEVRTLIRS